MTTMTPAHCRAMRGWLDWTQAELAGRTGISAASIREFEAGRPARKSTLQRLAWAFSEAGCRAMPSPLSGIVWREPAVKTDPPSVP